MTLMTNSETSSTVTVLVSFFLTPESGTVNDIKTTGGGGGAGADPGVVRVVRSNP